MIKISIFGALSESNTGEMKVKARIKNSYKKAVFSLSARHSNLFGSLYRYLYVPEKDSLSDLTSLFSKSVDKITVIQIGANDGINNDPVHKFIRRDRWQGVLLEPQKHVFEKFLQPLYKNTPGINVINAALDTADGFKPIYKLAVSNARWATGLTSFNRKVLENAIDSGTVEKQAKKEGIELSGNREDYIVEEKVQCISTSSLLNQFSIKRIDWLQIDTEGFDFEIIKMFNIENTKPSVISYENMHLSSHDKSECIRYLESNGYKTRDFDGNTVAMREPLKHFAPFFTKEE